MKLIKCMLGKMFGNEVGSSLPSISTKCYLFYGVITMERFHLYCLKLTLKNLVDLFKTLTTLDVRCSTFLGCS